MPKIKLNITVHNPNSAEETIKLLVPVVAEILYHKISSNEEKAIERTA